MRDAIKADIMEQRAKRDNSEMLIDKTSDTFSISERKEDNFYTSTPKKFQMDCCECRKHLVTSGWSLTKSKT